MTATLVPVDAEPYNFEHFCERFSRRELSETDRWVGFLVLRHLLGYPTAFEQLPSSLQHEARGYTTTLHYYEHNEDTTPAKVEQRPFLAQEIDRWPIGWEQQLQPIGNNLGLVLKL